MVKSYIARKGTRENVKTMADVTGGWSGLSRLVNRDSRGKKITRSQIKKVAEGKPTRLSDAQIRRINRYTNIDAASSNKGSLELKIAKKVRIIEGRNRDSVKRANLVIEAEGYEALGLVSDAIRTRDKIAAMDDTVEAVRLAARNAKTADDYRDISDISTP